MAQKLPANFVKRVNSGKEAGHVRKMTALREVVLTFTESEWSKLQAECRRLEEKEGRSLTGLEMVEAIVGKWLESSPQGARPLDEMGNESVQLTEASQSDPSHLALGFLLNFFFQPPL